MTAEHVVYETRAVKAGRRTLTPVAITSTQVLFSGGEHPRSTGRGGRRLSSDGCRALSTRASPKADTVSSQGGGDRHWPDRSTPPAAEVEEEDVDLQPATLGSPARSGKAQAIRFIVLPGCDRGSQCRRYAKFPPDQPGLDEKQAPARGNSPTSVGPVSTRRSRARVMAS